MFGVLTIVLVLGTMFFGIPAAVKLFDRMRPPSR